MSSSGAMSHRQAQLILDDAHSNHHPTGAQGAKSGSSFASSVLGKRTSWSNGSAVGPIAGEDCAKPERSTDTKYIIVVVGAHKDWGPPGFFPVSRLRLSDIGWSLAAVVSDVHDSAFYAPLKVLSTLHLTLPLSSLLSFCFYLLTLKQIECYSVSSLLHLDLFIPCTLSPHFVTNLFSFYALLYVILHYLTHFLPSSSLSIKELTVNISVVYLFRYERPQVPAGSRHGSVGPTKAGPTGLFSQHPTVPVQPW
ncbi:hypothetical protein XELAEV_18018986mg [Xenopus laevis]|uniref:Uncharacterized protein n=1 Tax=Xenopus laevis TaxID=8355 RepID=A0A974DE61_XENLA|nr:hypothetical protein XELAEV_18018986mg [Xenopus laevis]